MKKINNLFSKILVTILLFGIFILMYEISMTNFLLFHSLSEIFSVVIAVGIFMIAWNLRNFSKNYFLLFIGIASLFIGLIDFIHLLVYKGMSVFVGYDANLPTQLWIIARYIQSISFVAGLIFLKRKFNPGLVVFGYSVITIILLLSVFVFNIFPDAFIEGYGLTDFKKISEYVISVVVFLFIVLVYINRSKFDKKVFNWLIIAGISTIISEILFTFYVSVYGISNVFGHIFKIIAFYALYIAIIQTSLLEPYKTLFKSIELRSSELELSNKKLIEEINKRKEIEEKLRNALMD